MPAYGINYEEENAKKAELLRQFKSILERCQTILSNMALENNGAIFKRWPISHEPLRSDARNLLPLIEKTLESWP